MSTPKIVIYGPNGGSSSRPHWMLAELGLAYETAPLDMRAGDHKKPEYLAINPAGQAPAMTYDGFALSESAAIVRYLAEKHAPEMLGTTPEERATGLRWELYTLLNIDKNLSAHASKAWGFPSAPEVLAKADEALARFLPVLEGWLSSHAYLAGDTFTVADLNARCSFKYAELGEVDLSAYPAITGWMARCAERPAYAAKA